MGYKWLFCRVLLEGQETRELFKLSMKTIFVREPDCAFLLGVQALEAKVGQLLPKVRRNLLRIFFLLLQLSFRTEAELAADGRISH